MEAPDFALNNQNGKKVSLSDYRGQTVLLLFFPAAFSPTCTDEMEEVWDRVDDFGDVVVLGISVDSRWTLHEFSHRLNIGFNLLSDQKREVTEKYGLLRDNGTSERAYILIDKDGNIIYRHVMQDPSKKLDPEELLKKIM